MFLHLYPSYESWTHEVELLIPFSTASASQHRTLATRSLPAARPVQVRSSRRLLGVHCNHGRICERQRLSHIAGIVRSARGRPRFVLAYHHNSVELRDCLQ